MSHEEHVASTSHRRKYTQALQDDYKNLHVLSETPHIVRMNTILRDVDSPRDEFIFATNLLARSLIEAALDSCEYTPNEVLTPSGYVFTGLKLKKQIIGCSVLRAGEVLEGSLKDSVLDVRIGKLLVDETQQEGELFYAKLPQDADKCTIFLCDSVLDSGKTARRCIQSLLACGAKEDDIVFINFVSTSTGIKALFSEYPKIKIYTTMVDDQLNLGNVADLYYCTQK